MNLSPPPGEIVGGREAQPHSRPYMACLSLWHGHKSSFCRGFLVSGLAGEGGTGSSGAVVGFPYLQYNKVTTNNDIMLLQLWHNVELTEWVGLLPLPEANQCVIPGSECSVAGWGRTGVNTTTSRLHEVEREVVSDSLCRERYRHYNPITMLCAGSPHVNKSAFQVNIPLPGATGDTASCSRGRIWWKPIWPCPSLAPLPQEGSSSCIRGGAARPGRSVSRTSLERYLQC
uniref:Peptidase S1 domain-containing protein n=1 Tax=Gopherus evgoodei TaxID=1825980 RepID=A0A8C4WKB0_9SAUR